MKCFLTLIGLFLMGNNLIAQSDYDSLNYTVLHLSNKQNTDKWTDMNLTFGLNYTYTEGAIKRYVNPWGSFSLGIDIHRKYYYSFDVKVAPSRLKESFTEQNHAWQRDTNISMAAISLGIGYKFWASQRTALYFFGTIGYASLTAGKSSNQSNSNNASNRCEKEDCWTIGSFAPSLGFFFEVKQPLKSPNPYVQHDRYYRLKFTANPRSFRTIGSGVFYDVGVHMGF